MTLNVKFDQEKHDHNNILPLGNDEIKSILKSQSEAAFEDKNITNKSNFLYFSEGAHSRCSFPSL